MLEISPLVLALVPILIGLVQGLKQAGLNSKYAFPLSLLIGVGLANLVLIGQSWTDILLQGLMLSLVSSGLFSGTKKILE